MISQLSCQLSKMYNIFFIFQVQHVPQHSISHDPRNTNSTTISANLHDSHHLRHRQTNYTAPNVPLVNANASNSLRTNLITVPIQDNTIQAPIHENIPTASYYNQYPSNYNQTIPVHNIPPSPIMPMHNMNVPPPHIGAQPQGSAYYTPQTAYTQAQNYQAAQFAAPQYTAAQAPANYPSAGTQPAQARLGYEYNGGQQWTQNQQYYR